MEKFRQKLIIGGHSAAHCFSVELSEDGQTRTVHVENTTVSAQRAEELARSAGDRERGFLGSIRFLRRQAEGTTLYVFMDFAKDLAVSSPT